MQQRGFVVRGFAAGVERGADRVERLVVLAAQLLGEKLRLPLARDVRGDARACAESSRSVVRSGTRRELASTQRGQRFGELENVERLAPLLAAAGPRNSPVSSSFPRIDNPCSVPVIAAMP